MAQQLYITQEDIKAYLGIADDTTTYDKFFQLMIPKVMAYIDKYTGRTWGWGGDDPTDKTNYKSILDAYPNGEVYDGDITDTIWLNNTDIFAVDEVKVGNPNLGDPTVLTSQQYLWRNDGRLMLGGNYFESSIYRHGGDVTDPFYGGAVVGNQVIAVKYWYGVAGVPDDIAMACLDILQGVFIGRKAQGIGSERIGEYEIRYDTQFRAALGKAPDTLRILDGYRMPRM